MIVHALKHMLIHVQTVSVEKTPPMKRQYIDQIPELTQPEPKRPRIEVNCLSPEKNRNPITIKSKRSIKHASENYYRWNPEYLIAFPWLQYKVKKRIASCRFVRCKMYHLQFL